MKTIARTPTNVSPTVSIQGAAIGKTGASSPNGNAASGEVWDLFLSHNDADKAWVTELAAQLESEPLTSRPDSKKIRVFLDAWDIHAGENIITKLNAGLANSRFVAIIMSPEFFRANWTVLEWTHCVAEDPRNTRGRIIPILHRDVSLDGKEAISLPAPFRALKHLDFRTPKSRKVFYRELLNRIRGLSNPRGPSRSPTPETFGIFVNLRPPVCVALSADAKWIAGGGEDEVVSVWRFEPNKVPLSSQLVRSPEWTFRGVDGLITSLVFTPEGGLLAACRDGTVMICYLPALLKTNTGAKIITLTTNCVSGGELIRFVSNPVLGAFLEQNGSRVVFCRGSRELWAFGMNIVQLTKTKPKVYYGQDETARSWAFPGDDSCLVTGDTKGCILVWFGATESSHP